MRLFCDCKTDEEKSNFFLSGMAVETGVIAPAISNDVAMAYHRCAQFKKENDELRARIEAMEKQEPVAWMFKVKRTTVASVVLDEFAAIDYFPQDNEELVSKEPLYTAPVDAKAIRAEAFKEAAEWCDRLANNGSLDAEDCAAAIRELK